MSFVGHEDVVEALPPNRADQAPDVTAPPATGTNRKKTPTRKKSKQPSW
jgi:hypothetical protein